MPKIESDHEIREYAADNDDGNEHTKTRMTTTTTTMSTKVEPTVFICHFYEDKFYSFIAYAYRGKQAT